MLWISKLAEVGLESVQSLDLKNHQRELSSAKVIMRVEICVLEGF